MLRLLPLLLLVSTVYAQYFQDSVTEAVKGFNNFEFNFSNEYYIPDGKCSGYLDLKKLGCKYSDQIYPPKKVKVRVEGDPVPAKVNIHAGLESVTIYRDSPCSGKAYVKLWIACPILQSGGRRNNVITNVNVDVKSLDVKSLPLLPKAESHSL